MEINRILIKCMWNHFFFQKYINCLPFNNTSDMLCLQLWVSDLYIVWKNCSERCNCNFVISLETKTEILVQNILLWTNLSAMISF